MSGFTNSQKINTEDAAKHAQLEIKTYKHTKQLEMVQKTNNRNLDLNLNRSAFENVLTLKKKPSFIKKKIIENVLSDKSEKVVDCGEYCFNTEETLCDLDRRRRFLPSSFHPYCKLGLMSNLSTLKQTSIASPFWLFVVWSSALNEVHVIRRSWHDTQILCF